MGDGKRREGKREKGRDGIEGEGMGSEVKGEGRGKGGKGEERECW